MSRSKYRPRHHFHGRGPSWYRKHTTSYPLRREAKRVLKQAVDLDTLMFTPYNRLREYWL